MQDQPFRINPVTVELASVARKNHVDVGAKEVTDEETRQMRIFYIKKQLNTDREALRTGKMIVNGKKIEINTHQKNLLNTRIRRAIDMLDKEHGLNPVIDMGFNEVLDKQGGSKI